MISLDRHQQARLLSESYLRAGRKEKSTILFDGQPRQAWNDTLIVPGTYRTLFGTECSFFCWCQVRIY
jgi:hypothetical protein